MRAVTIALFAVVALLAVACGAGGASSGDDGGLRPETTEDPTAENPLADTQWHLEAMELGSEGVLFTGSAVPTLEFTEDTLMMSDGVNTARGPYSFDGDEFAAGPLASTLIGYPEPTQPAFELIALIDGATAAEVDGDQLTIEVATGSLVYAEGAAEPDVVVLTDTSWSLTDISRGNEVINATLAPVPAVVTFSDGTVEAYDGVNTAAGTFDQDGMEVSIDLGAPSDIAVAGEVFPQFELFDLLPLVVSAELVDESSLLLGLEDGSLRFDPVGGGVPGG